MNKTYLFMEYKLRMINGKEDHALRLLVDAYADALSKREDLVTTNFAVVDHDGYDCGLLDNWVATLIKSTKPKYKGTQIGKSEIIEAALYRIWSKYYFNVMFNGSKEDRLFDNFNSQYIEMKRLFNHTLSLDEYFDSPSTLLSKKSPHAHIDLYERQLLRLLKSAFTSLCFPKTKEGDDSEFANQFTVESFAELIYKEKDFTLIDYLYSHMMKFLHVKEHDDDEETIIERVIVYLGTIDEEIASKLDFYHTNALMSNTTP